MKKDKFVHPSISQRHSARGRQGRGRAERQMKDVIIKFETGQYKNKKIKKMKLGKEKAS